MSQELNRGKGMELTTAEETLRLVAQIPTPEGLEERVKARLKDAPQTGRVLAWPGSRWSHSALVRGAAAAMIVCAVGVGAWRVYAHVQSGINSARAMPAPIRQAAPGSFSNAGAMRSPQSLNGPVLVHPVKPQSKKKDTAMGRKSVGAAKPETAKTRPGPKGVEAVGNKLEPMKAPAPQLGATAGE